MEQEEFIQAVRVRFRQPQLTILEEEAVTIELD